MFGKIESNETKESRKGKSLLELKCLYDFIVESNIVLNSKTINTIFNVCHGKSNKNVSDLNDLRKMYSDNLKDINSRYDNKSINETNDDIRGRIESLRSNEITQNEKAFIIGFLGYQISLLSVKIINDI